MTLHILVGAIMMATTPSLERLAEDVSVTVIQNKLEGPIGVFVEGPSPTLNRALGSVVMARLAKHKLGPVPVTSRDAPEAERWARENRLRSVLRLGVSLEGPKVVLRGDALSTWVNFWSGNTPTRTGPAAAIALQVDADPEAVTLGGGTPSPSRPLELTVSVLARLPAQPAALAIGDLDGDHRAEIVALVADGISTWTGDGKYKGRVELNAALTSACSREPFGLLSFKDGKLLAWSSRRETAEVFSWQRDDWHSVGQADAPSIGPFVFKPRPGFASFERELTWAGRASTWVEPLQHVSLWGANVALGVTSSGNASITRGQVPTNQVKGVGSGSVLADFDADGTPDVVASTTRSIGDSDELRVVSLIAFESLQSRGAQLSEAPVIWQKAINGRALVAAAGDLDGDGVDEVVIGTWFDSGTGELLVLRRTP